MDSTELASLDGRIAPSAETSIPVMDEGFIRGDGAFEVIRVYDGKPFALDQHLDRIERSATNLRLGWDVPRAELEREVAEILEQRGGADFDGCVRLILTRGQRRLVMTEPLPPTPERARLGLVTFGPTRVLDGVKSLSYAANMLAGRMARERGFDEALLVTPHGRVLEAPTSSLFYVDGDGALVTPPLEDHILASITRHCVMELLDVEERPTTQDDLNSAQEAFLASTTREVQSVAAIEDKEFADVGERTREAQQALRAHIEETLAA